MATETARGTGDPVLSPTRSTAVASLAITVIAFLIVTGEQVPIGLLREVAHGVHTKPATVGLVTSWYALIAGGSAVPTTRLAAHLDRRFIMVGCAIVFGAGHLLAAAAPSVAVLLVGRAIAALGHGLYFAVAGPAIIRLAPPELKARAGSRIAVGASSAMILGTPLAVLIGQATSWRVAMLTVAITSMALALLVARLLPPMPAQHQDQPRAEGSVAATLRSRALVVLLITTAVTVTGHFTLFTFITPYADARLDIRAVALSLLLLTFGLAGVAGSALGGRLAESGPITGMRAASVVYVAALVGIWGAAAHGWTAVGVVLAVLWGGTFSVIAVCMGLAVLRRSPGPRAETGNALGGIVFQLGIVSGSAIGSFAYSHGQLAELPLLAAAIALVTLALSVWGGRAFRGGSFD